MKTLIIAIVAIASALCFEGCKTDTACSVKGKTAVTETQNGIRYYVLNKETHEFVGFAVGADGKGYKVIEVEGDDGTEGLEITQTNKTHINTEAVTYTKEDLCRMFGDYIKDKTFLERMDKTFELGWIDNSGNKFVYKTKPFSRM